MNATRDVIDQAIADLLATNTGKAVGVAWIASDAALPYAIVYPMPAGSDLGAWAQPNEDREFTYQIKCVGADARQAGWMSSKINAIMTNRSGADYQYPLVITGAATHWRITDTLGAIVASGDDLFESNDIYRVRMGV